MKKILILLIFVILLSCKKEATFCWDCQIKKITIFNGGSSTTSTTTVKCDYSTREIELFEQAKTSGSTTTTATCTRQ